MAVLDDRVTCPHVWQHDGAVLNVVHRDITRPSPPPPPDHHGDGRREDSHGSRQDDDERRGGREAAVSGGRRQHVDDVGPRAVVRRRGQTEDGAHHLVELYARQRACRVVSLEGCNRHWL